MTPPRRTRGPARPATPALVRDALSFVPAELDRDTWAMDVLAAIKSEFGDAGRDLAEEYSQRSETFKQDSFNSTWRNVKASGGKGIGSLFRLAQQHGFRFPDARGSDDASGGAMSPSAAAADAAAREARTRRDREELAQRQARAEKAARKAVLLWEGASEVGRSPYLERKGVDPFGVRFLPSGELLVPMRNAAGELRCVQRIAPEKPADGSSGKRFLFGGSVAGLWHLIGDLAGADAVLIGEGYATCASVHQATGRPVVVAFNKGNLLPVAKELRTLNPALLLVVCADDDRETEARSGKNPGRAAAAAVARATRGDGALTTTVFPEGLPPGGTDFNDLHASAGLEAVRVLIEGAVKEGKAAQVQQKRRKTQAAKQSGGGGGGGDAEDAPIEDDPFELVTEEQKVSTRDWRCDRPGVWFLPRDAEGNRKRPVWVCTPLHVTARTRTEDGNGWGMMLEFTDPDRQPKKWAMPSALLSGDGSEWAARLRDMGLRMAPGTTARSQISRYLDTREPKARITCTEKVGWHGGGVYVLPGDTIGAAPNGVQYAFQSDAGLDDTFKIAGSLEDWQRDVADLCVGNSRLVFSVCCALGGALMSPTHTPTGGFHMAGSSSLGKSTGLLVAASVWGSPRFKQQWRTTDNALESTAAQHNDCTLILDEISQADGRIVGECSYLLSNEQAKGRSTRGGQLRRRGTWRLLFLSSGEKGLGEHMLEAGKKPNEGQLVRMPSVPADAGAGLGMMEDIHGFASSKDFAESIVLNAATSYGTAGRAWIEWLAENMALAQEKAGELMREFEFNVLPEHAQPQVGRVAHRFALVAAAGELASAHAGITGWPSGEAMRSVSTCFSAWLLKRGHVGSGEKYAMLAQVKSQLEKNGESLYTWFQRGMDDHKPNTPLRYGFVRAVDENGRVCKIDPSEKTAASLFDKAKQYLCFPEQFKREICKGFDHEEVAMLLRDRGHLQCDEGRLTTRQRVPGFDKPIPFYLIKPSIFNDEFEGM